MTPGSPAKHPAIARLGRTDVAARLCGRNLRRHYITIFSNDSIQHLTGAVNIGPDGGTLVTQWSGKNLRLEHGLTGSGPSTIDSVQNQGTVVFASAADTYTDSAALTVTFGGSLELDNSATFAALSGGGNITVSAGVGLSVGSDSGTSAFSGALGGQGQLLKTGNSQLILSGANTYSGSTSISARK